MTAVYMNADEMHAIQRKLLKLQSSIQRITSLTNTKIYGVAPHWQSTSANIFFEQYGEASGVFSEVVEILGEIASELEVDITAWEVMSENPPN